MFNTESVYFRTEGDLANAGRSNGLQNDAGRNAGGSFYTLFAKNNTAGVFYDADQPSNGSGLADYNPYWQVGRINMDLSRAYTTANEFRVKNRLKRIYKLLTINGKKVSDIIGA